MPREALLAGQPYQITIYYTLVEAESRSFGEKKLFD
jgi:hypothetical protein